MLESCFPQFPTENAFLHHVQSRAGQEERLHTLLQFTMEKHRLQVHAPIPFRSTSHSSLPFSCQVGGQLLPDLIQFYQWLHTHLAHQVTHRRAYSALSIGRVVALASRRMPRGMAIQLQELYQRVKSEFR